MGFQSKSMVKQFNWKMKVSFEVSCLDPKLFSFKHIAGFQLPENRFTLKPFWVSVSCQAVTKHDIASLTVFARFSAVNSATNLAEYDLKPWATLDYHMVDVQPATLQIKSNIGFFFLTMMRTQVQVRLATVFQPNGLAYLQGNLPMMADAREACNLF